MLECTQVNVVVSTKPAPYIYRNTYRNDHHRRKYCSCCIMDSTTAVLLIFVSVLVCCHSTVIVSKDGSGNYTTVSEAIMKAPDMSDKPYTIHVRAGTYEEYVTIPAKKTNIKLVGDGPHLTKLVGYQNGSTIGTYLRTLA